MILEHPTPEFFIVYQILTNSGVPADLSKSRLRPILNQVFGIALNNRYLASDAQQLSTMLDDIRNDGDRPKAERVLMLEAQAASSEPFRLNITARRDSHMRELKFLVNQLGAKDPEGLLRKNPLGGTPRPSARPSGITRPRRDPGYCGVPYE